MRKNYRLDENFELTGIFSIAGTPIEDGKFGKLTYKYDSYNANIELVVYCEFMDFLGKNIINESDHNKLYTISGYSEDGYTLIMDNVVMINPIFTSNGIPYSKFRIGRCLFLYTTNSDCLDKVVNHIMRIGIDNLQVINSAFSFNGMNEWMDRSLLKRSNDEKKKSIYFNLDDIKSKEYKVTKQNISISNSVDIIDNNNHFFEDYYWKIKPIKYYKLSLGGLVNNIKILKELLQFFVNTPINLTYLKFNIFIGGVHDNIILSYLIFSHYKNFKDNAKIKIDVPFYMIENKFESIIEKWFEKRHKLSIIVENYLHSISSNYYNHMNLTNNIRNLEIFHRNFIEDKAPKIDEELENYKCKLKKFINQNIDDESYRKRFLGNIEFNPETTLYKRLKEMFKNLDEEMKIQIFKRDGKSLSKSIGSMSSRLVKTRNYYTHGDIEKLSPDIIQSGADIIYYSSMLNQILKYYIYSELFDLDEEIIRIICNGIIKLISDNGGNVNLEENFAKEVNRKLKPEERQKVIFNLLTYYKNQYKVEDLAYILSVSISTIRRDLEELEVKGLVKITKNGIKNQYESVL